MDESVTSFALGKIPATTKVCTEEQVDAKIADLRTAVSGVTESGWQTLADIINDAESVVRRQELDGLVAPICGDVILASGANSGAGVTAVYYWKNASGTQGSHAVRVFDEDMFSGEMSGEEAVKTVCEAHKFFQYVKGTDISGAGNVAGERLESVYWTLSGLGLTSSGSGSTAYKALSRILSGASSSSGSIAFLPSGATDFCNGVQSCVSGYGFVTSQQLSGMGFVTATDLSGLTSSLSGLNAAVCGLRSATCGISLTLSGMADAISGLPDAIVEAIDSAPLLTEEVKEKAKAAVLPAVRDMNQTLNAKKDDIAAGLAAVANALDDNDPTAVDSVSEALSEVADATETVDLSEASEAASSGAEDASAAATAASNESTTIEALPGFVP